MFCFQESDSNYPHISESLAAAFPDQYSDKAMNTVDRLRAHL